MQEREPGGASAHPVCPTYGPTAGQGEFGQHQVEASGWDRHQHDDFCEGEPRGIPTAHHRCSKSHQPEGTRHEVQRCWQGTGLKREPDGPRGTSVSKNDQEALKEELKQTQEMCKLAKKEHDKAVALESTYLYGTTISELHTQSKSDDKHQKKIGGEEN